MNTLLPSVLLKESVFDNDLPTPVQEDVEESPKAYIDYGRVPAPAPVAAEPGVPTAVPAPIISSPLEKKTSVEELHEGLFGSDDNGLMRGAQFLSTLAEAESGRGKYLSNPNSSATGLYHFLVRNGGGYTKDGVKSPLGQYDKAGARTVSSYQYAKDSLAKIVKSSPAMLSNQDLASDFKIISASSTPKMLTAKQQSLLAYAYLYNRAPKDFSSYIKGTKAGVDLYAKEWVTLSGSHTYNDIARNWGRASSRTANAIENLNFIGINMPIVDDMVKLAPLQKQAPAIRPALSKGQLEKKKELLAKKLNLL
jgi:hypothetical protein